MKNENKLASTPVKKLLISMSLPAMLSMLVQALYNIVDSIFISFYAQEGLTAVTLAFPVQMLLISISVGIGVGINSLVSRRLGEQKHDEAGLAASHGLYFALISWAIFLVFGLFFAKPFIHSFTDNAVIAEMGTSYLSIVTIFSFGVFIQVITEKTIQASGDMVRPMIGQLIGAITNIILDPIFIFGIGIVPKFGVAGAAIATVIGQLLAMTYLMYALLFKQKALHIKFKGFRFNKKITIDIFQVGLPSIIMQSVGSLLGVSFNGILASFSDVAVAAIGVYMRLQSFVLMPLFGMNSGIMPIVGYNFGAKNKARIIETLKLSIYFAVAMMAVSTAVFWVFPEQLLAIFDADAELVEIATPALRIISLNFVPASISIILSTAFQAFGEGKTSMFLSLARQLFVLLPLAYALSFIGLNYIWLAFPVAEVSCCVLSALTMKRVYKKYLKDL